MICQQCDRPLAPGQKFRTCVYCIEDTFSDLFAPPAPTHAEAILGLLRKQSPGVVTIEQLCLERWPHATHQAATANLRVHINRIRGGMLAVNERLLCLRGQGYSLYTTEAV